jgi:hypothetical protein
MLWLIGAVSVADAASEVARPDPQLLSEDRILLGIVVEIRSDLAKIDLGEEQFRYVPMKDRTAKGLTDLKKGALVEITVNDQNLIVDVHKVGEASHHHVVRGQPAGPLPPGHDAAAIRTHDGQEASHVIQPVVKSKVASIPVGADAVFLLDEVDKVADVTLGSVDSVHRAADLGPQKSPAKGNMNQVVGVILKPLKDQTIVLRTEDGNDHSYEVRSLIQPRLARLSRGVTVVFLVDEENKVADVAVVTER